MQLPQQSAHWYKASGDTYSACYEVPKADGKGMRKPTIEHARAMGLLPSVTTILKVIDKPSINNYRVYQALMSSFTLPRIPGEAEDAFAKRVIKDSEEHSKGARDFGTDMHKCIEDYYKLRMAAVPAPLSIFFTHWREWSDVNITKVYSAEQIVGDSSLGFAGMLDLHCELKDVGPCILDVKTQAIKKEQPIWYPEWPVQLAAYASALRKDVARVSVVIDSKTPRAPFVHVWPKTQDAYYLFLAAFDWWKYLNDYDPAQKDEPI